MNEDQDRTASLGFEQYVFVLKRQWRVVAAVTLLGALIAGAYLVIAPTTVTATTTLNLNVITTDPFNPQRAASGLLDDVTEADIASSHVVAARAAEAMSESLTATEIRQASTVSTSSGATVVKVAFDGDSAAQAIEGADAVAAAYLAFRSEQADARIEVMVGNLAERIDALNATLATVNETIASSGQETAAYAQATTQRSQILTELDGLLSQRNELQSVDTTGGIVLTAAEDSTLDYSPGRTITLLTGLAAGLVLGVIAAFVRNPFDRRLRNPVEMSRALDAPVFVSVDARREDVPPVGEAADAVRVARERMLAELYLGSTVLVLDATRASSVSTTAINLAVVTAQVGHDVQLLVPEAEDAVRAKLEEALELQGDGEGRFRSARIPALSYVQPEDTGDENQGDLLLTSQAHAVIDATPEDALTFLVLTSSAHPATILAALRVAQAVVIVTREKETLLPELRWLREEAEGIETPVIGAVVERAARHTENRGVLGTRRSRRAPQPEQVPVLTE
ncbi:hypothetical protein ACWGJP_03640 [Microbacterium sp. NPDC055903]